MAGREEEREEVRRQMKGDNYEVMVDQSYSSMCVLAPKIEERRLGALEATAEEPLLLAAATTPSGGGAKQRVHARPGPGQ